FEVVLKGSSVTYKGLVSKSCHLSAAEMAMLATLPSARSISTTSAISTGASPPGPAPAPGPAPPAPTYIRTLDSLGDEFLLTKVAGPNGTDLITGLPLTTVDATLHHVEDTEHVVFATGIGELSLRPLRRVTATATRVTELPLDSGEVSLPAGVPDNDPRTEVGRGGAAFNRM